jgi:hypothetical protein
MTITVDDYQTVPVGDFRWIAQVRGENCAYCDCQVSWSWEYTGNLPPRVTPAGNVVAVTAPLLSGHALTSPVTPGVLTLTPTVTCPEIEGLVGSGDPTELEPITLTIGSFAAGWTDRMTGKTNILSLSETIGTYDDVWLGKVNGTIGDCVVDWEFTYDPPTWSPTINVNNHVITVTNPGSGGSLVATPTVWCGAAEFYVNSIYLTLLVGPQQLIRPWGVDDTFQWVDVIDHLGHLPSHQGAYYFYLQYQTMRLVMTNEAGDYLPASAISSVTATQNGEVVWVTGDSSQCLVYEDVVCSVQAFYSFGLEDLWDSGTGSITFTVDVDDGGANVFTTSLTLTYEQNPG